jgi:hypothetical protein
MHACHAKRSPDCQDLVVYIQSPNDLRSSADNSIRVNKTPQQEGCF